MAKAFAIWLLALACLSANAQSVFKVSGKVTDSSGAALSHASVELRSSKDSLEAKACGQGTEMRSEATSASSNKTGLSVPSHRTVSSKASCTSGIKMLR